MKTIDLVIPYVNNNDKVWQNTYLNYWKKHDFKKLGAIRGHRFEDIGLINYQLKLVNKNLPWINTIFLLLSNIEQAPKDLPSNCKIVLHKEFIPYNYLPTFNSCTIEMFLWNIPGLGEHFIYANDDMLPLKPLKKSDFFYGNHIKMGFEREELTRESTMFKHQCYNSYKSVTKLVGLDDKNWYFRPFHTFTPMIKSHCEECFDAIKDDILPNIRACRTENQHNQYIYPLFEKLIYGSYDSAIPFYYSHLDENEDELVKKIQETTIFCANVILNKENGNILERELKKLCE